MKKIIIITALKIMGFGHAMAQPLQYFMQRSSTNIAAVSEVQTLQTFLSGGQSLQGFEGAPRHILLNVASPLTVMDGLTNGNSSNRSKRSHSSVDEPSRNFTSVTISHESFGAHSNFSATLGYNYRMLISDNANITFGLGGGVKSMGSNYGKHEPGTEPYDRKETSFATQIGARFEMDRLNVSVFTNAGDYFGELVWGRLWDGGTSGRDDGGWNDFGEKSWHGQVAVLGRYSPGTKENTIRIAANAVYKDGLGVGISYGTGNDLSANASFRFTKHLRIGYAYQLLHFNPIARKHEIAIRYRFVRKAED